MASEPARWLSRFHDLLPATAFTSRKALAAHAQHQVATGLEDFRAAA